MHMLRLTPWTFALVVLVACDETGAPSARDEREPAPTVSADRAPKVTAVGAVTDGAEIVGVNRVVETMLTDFQACYRSALERSPQSRGSVRVTVEVARSGAIGSASTAASKGINKKLATCIADRVRRGKFEAPKGPRATVTVTVDLSP